jgi:cell division protein FtsQ
VNEMRNVRRSRPSDPAAPPMARAVSEPPPRDSRVWPVLRSLLGVVLIVGLASGVAYGARRYVRASHRFAVAEIVTSGGKRRSPDELASLAGIAKGQNVFALDLDRARARLAADAWIESAELSRQLPSTVTIRVVEKEAAGLVATNEGTYLVNHEGAIIKRVEGSDPVDAHVVTGLTLQALLDDRDGATRTIRHALELANDYDRSPLAQRAPLQEVHLEPAGDMTLVVGKAGLVLRMGRAPYRRKLEQAVRIMAELDRRGAKAETIMLDDDARPERVVVRMR